MSSHQEAPGSLGSGAGTTPSPAPWRTLFLRHFPRRQFVLGALAPALIFYLFQRFNAELTGAVVAGAWGLAVAIWEWRRMRRVDVFAAVAVTLLTIEIVMTLVTRSPTFYLAAAAIDELIQAAIFLGSLLVERPLIQVMAEATGATTGVPDELRQAPAYHRAWWLLTAIWGLVKLGKAVVLIAAQIWLPVGAFLAVRMMAGWPLFVALLAFSYWFPGWYWRRQA